MKTIRLNWKRSLATFALLAAFNGPDATPAGAASGKPAVVSVAAPASKEQSQGAGAAALLSQGRGPVAPAQQPTQPPASSPPAKASVPFMRDIPPDAPAYQEQPRDGATHVSGTIQHEVTWTLAKSPYVMDASVYVDDEGTLKIEPGVVVKVTRATEAPRSFEDYTGLLVMGRLVAEGTPAARIRFAPAAASPQPGREWRGIFLHPRSLATILKWTIVEGAATGVHVIGSAFIAHNVFWDCGMGMFLQEGEGEVTHNVITRSTGRGVLFNSTGWEASLTDNIFYQNGFAIEVVVWDASPYADYNLCFASGPHAPRFNYGGTEPGLHDVQEDPLFVKPEGDDFRLESNSPARRAGRDHSDLGLDIEHWSPESARQENARWLADGGRKLWMHGLGLETPSPRAAQVAFEAALKKPLEPNLKDKVSCALGRVLTAQGNAEAAQPILRKVISESQNPHLRDMARRYLADALLMLNQDAEASAVLDAVEWPQSKAWLDAAKARCHVQDPPRALACLEPIRGNDPRYFRAVSELVFQALEDDRPQSAMALCQGFDAYPTAAAGSGARLRVAEALQRQEDTENAAKLLKQIVDTDPFGPEAPQALSLLAKFASRPGHAPGEAPQLLRRLCTDYYLFDSLVGEAREQIGFKPLSPRTTILLDVTMGEASPYDRVIYGSGRSGQYELMMFLSRHGFKVHTNERRRPLVPEEMQYYGLVIMNGRSGARAKPPMTPEAISACETYVKQGGNLLVIAPSERFGGGGTHLFYNPLLERFGMKFRQGAGVPWARNSCVVTSHPALQGLDGFTAFGGVTIDPGAGEILGTYEGEPIIVAMPYGKGRVVAAGLGVAVLGWNRSRPSAEEQEDIRKNAALLNRLATYLLANAPSEAPVPIPPAPKRAFGRITAMSRRLLPTSQNHPRLPRVARQMVGGVFFDDVTVINNAKPVMSEDFNTGKLIGWDTRQSWVSVTGEAPSSKTPCLYMNRDNHINTYAVYRAFCDDVGALEVKARVLLPPPAQQWGYSHHQMERTRIDLATGFREDWFFIAVNLYPGEPGYRVELNHVAPPEPEGRSARGGSYASKKPVIPSGKWALLSLKLDPDTSTATVSVNGRPAASCRYEPDKVKQLNQLQLTTYMGDVEPTEKLGQ